jgi:Flp pilus assembly protein TadD
MPMNATQDAAPEAATPDFSNRLSDGQANAIYTSAYHLSNQGRHEQATALFALLGLYRPKDPKYAHAVAISFRRMGNYEEAIRMFARTMELRPDDYGPAFQLIECMLLLGRRDEAKGLLDTIVGAAQHDGQTATVERAAALLELIEGA